jgi:hypothetical protein
MKERRTGDDYNDSAFAGLKCNQNIEFQVLSFDMNGGKRGNFSCNEPFVNE